MDTLALTDSLEPVQPELVVNGDFATDSDWIKNTNIGNINAVQSISDNKLTLTSTSDEVGASYQDILFEDGATYQVSFEVVSTNLVSQVRVGTSAATSGAAVIGNICNSGDAVIGENTFTYTHAGSNSFLTIGGRNDVTSVVFANVSVKETTTGNMD